METEYPIKETVKTIVITKQKQKINFQIRHPENVSAIIGIAVTCNKIADYKEPGVDFDKGIMAGTIALAIPQKGDVVYGETVLIDNNDYADTPEKQMNNYHFEIGSAKTRQFYFDTNYIVDKALLEGYYEDVYSPKLTGKDGLNLPYLYIVKVYIRYQVKIKSNTEKP